MLFRSIVDQHGQRRAIEIPQERPLTVFVDKRELVTLMTLGASPELLVLGYLLNQNLVHHAGEVESIDVDWDVGAAALKTRVGVKDLGRKTARRVVTTGCGQGTVFGDAMAQIDAVRLPSAQSARIAQGTLLRILEEKGHLRHKQEGLRYVYVPSRPRAQAARSALRGVLQTFFEGSLEKAVAAHLGDAAASLSLEELERLAALIRQARTKGK